MKRFNTKAKCIKYLEKIKWNGKPISPFTGKTNVTKRANSINYHCNDTNKDFSVLNGTIFEKSKYPLPDWFLLISLMLNAKKGISAMELMRNLGCSYKTAWYSAMRVRCAMIDTCIELENIVEMDEACVGGKPRKVQKNNTNNQPIIATITNKRGRGTRKTPIVGVVERNGDVVLKVVSEISKKVLLAMLKENVNIKKSIVITDELPSYKAFDDVVQHLTINHKKQQFSNGIIHTNTIEGFWAIVKNSIRGQYIALSKKYLPLYLVQAQYIYNRRNSKDNLFDEFMKLAIDSDKQFNYYKPTKSVKSITYPKTKNC